MSSKFGITYPDRETWLEARSHVLGASDVAAALGFSPWKTPMQLWAEKTGKLPPDDLAALHERIEWGLRSEPMIVEAFGQRTGRRVQLATPFTIVQHRDYPWLAATPDANQYSEAHTPHWGILQVKTTNEMLGKDWRDTVPLHYQIQVQAELACTGAAWGSIAVLIGGQKLVWYDVERDENFIAEMIETAREFWRHVERDTMPDVDESPLTSRVLNKMHPDDMGGLVDVDTRHDEIFIQSLRDTVDSAEAVIQLHENEIKAALGEHTFARLPDGTVYSWKTFDRKGFTVEPTKGRTLRKMGDKAADKLLKDMEP